MTLNRITTFKEFMDGVITIDIWVVVLTSFILILLITIWRIRINTKVYKDMWLEMFRTYMNHQHPETIVDLTETVKLYKEDE